MSLHAQCNFPHDRRSAMNTKQTMRGGALGIILGVLVVGALLLAAYTKLMLAGLTLRASAPAMCKNFPTRAGCVKPGKAT